MEDSHTDHMTSLSFTILNMNLSFFILEFTGMAVEFLYNPKIEIIFMYFEEIRLLFSDPL